MLIVKALETRSTIASKQFTGVTISHQVRYSGRIEKDSDVNMNEDT
jgi:hypothetical protein